MNWASEPPRRVRRLRTLGRLESCQEIRTGGIPPELKERAVRMVGEIRADHESD